MANEETIVNRIITLNEIEQIANYLENKKEEYIRLINIDETKNRGLKFTEQKYEYKATTPPVIDYMISYRDNKTMTQEDYNWFVGNLANPEDISRIRIELKIRYSENYTNPERYNYKHMNISISFSEDSTRIMVNSEQLENETYTIYNDIIDILNNTQERYNKTIKNRNFRIQSFCLSIGFVLSYVVFIVLKMVNLPEEINDLLSNKFVIILGQWFISAIIGNMIGYNIIAMLYKNLIPKTKYAGWDKSKHKATYIDNVDEFIGHNEVQIGQFANNGKAREKIEKIYRITNKIVLIQLLVSIILFFILK